MTLIFFSENITDSDSFILAAARAFSEVSGSELAFSVDRSGEKPQLMLADGTPSGLYVSLSHSGKFIACAVSDKDVGLDIQEERDVDFPAISAKLFNRTTNDKKQFYALFCAGEARKKLTGRGLPESMLSDKPEARIIDFFEGYTLALCGGDENVFLEEGV